MIIPGRTTMNLTFQLTTFLLIVFLNEDSLANTRNFDDYIDSQYQNGDAYDATNILAQSHYRPMRLAAITHAIESPNDAFLIGTTTECEPDLEVASTAAHPDAAKDAKTGKTGKTCKGDSKASKVGKDSKEGKEATAESGKAAAAKQPARIEDKAGSAKPAADAEAKPPAAGSSPQTEGTSKQLHQLVQPLYIVQARVQLEVNEIRKAQAVADAAQVSLEDSSNHVRAVTAALQTAQQEVASAAIRAQTAQLQLAAHDQLLFAARQDVDALSSQMVGLQAAESIQMPKTTFDVTGLMDRLRQPLPDAEKPTAIPPVVPIPSIFQKGVKGGGSSGGGGGKGGKAKTER